MGDEQDKFHLQQEDLPNFLPIKTATGDDFLKLTPTALTAKKTELQKKISEMKKVIKEYKKKVESLVSHMNEAGEPSEILCKEVTSSRDSIQNQLQINMRNKEITFKRLMEDIAEQRDRMKPCDDNSSEARRQIEEAKKYLRREKHYYDMIRISNIQKILIYFYKTHKWIGEALFR